MAKAAAADQLGDAYLLLQDHENSVKWYQRGLDIRLAANKAAKKLAKKTGEEAAAPATDSQLILSYASLSHALRQALKLSEAGAMAEKALAIANKASNHHVVPPAVMSMLLTLQSGIAECQGDYVTALLKIEQSLKVAPPTDLEHVRMHLDLLRRVVSSEQHRMPPQVAAQMTSRGDKIVEFLLTQGYEHRNQFPKYYVPGLEALAWHELDSIPSYAGAISLLRAAAASLREEYATLRDHNLLSPERECIHDISQGQWRRFEITGFWNNIDASTNCSKHTPAACKLLADLRKAGLPVLRAGFSALEGNTWLKAHYGTTNAQLKMHLGLIVPQSGQCSLFRVGSETRGWREGEVIFFDDSFDHEVWNKCNSERVVFQVVFAHYGLSNDHDSSNNQEKIGH